MLRAYFLMGAEQSRTDADNTALDRREYEAFEREQDELGRPMNEDDVKRVLQETSRDYWSHQVNRKISYLKERTHGGFDVVTADNLQRADDYAALLTIRDELRAAGQPLALRYLAEDGGEATLDLSPLATDQSTRDQEAIDRVVSAYRIEYLPATLFVKDVPQTPEVLRQELAGHIRHGLNRAEQWIAGSDLSNYHRNVVRLELRRQLDDKLAAITDGLQNGSLTLPAFKEALQSLEAVWQQAKYPQVVFDGSTVELKQLLKDARRDARGRWYGEDLWRIKKESARGQEALLSLAA
jgi:hypothetical protein